MNGEQLYQEIKKICNSNWIYGQRWTEIDIVETGDRIYSFFESEGYERINGTLRLSSTKLQLKLFHFVDHCGARHSRCGKVGHHWETVYNFNVPLLSADLRLLDDLRTHIEKFRKG